MDAGLVGIGVRGALVSHEPVRCLPHAPGEGGMHDFMQTRMETSFAQYVETYRLERSLVLFSEKQMTIGEITTLCGYSNPQTFRRAFQKRYGMLPSDYQKTVLYQKK